VKCIHRRDLHRAGTIAHSLGILHILFKDFIRSVVYGVIFLGGIVESTPGARSSFPILLLHTKSHHVGSYWVVWRQSDNGKLNHSLVHPSWQLTKHKSEIFMFLRGKGVHICSRRGAPFVSKYFRRSFMLECSLVRIEFRDCGAERIDHRISLSLRSFLTPTPPACQTI
jgi:hypothetical protein